MPDSVYYSFWPKKKLVLKKFQDLPYPNVCVSVRVREREKERAEREREREREIEFGSYFY